MRTLSRRRCSVLAALLVVGGCATAGGAGQGFDGRAKQADEKLPLAARFYDQGERALVEEAQERQLAARKAVEQGNLDKARAEFAAAAERYARFADAYPASEWRIAFRYKAAEFLLFSQQHEPAAAQADKLLADPAASDVTRAMASQLSAVAWRGVAVQKIKAGELEPLKLVTAEQRAGAELSPRPPAEPWRRFVGAVDAFLPVWEKHPEMARRPAERNLALPPWQAALIAAEVQYASDDMAGAQQRLERLLAAWPSEADVVDGAVQLLLQTFLVRKDDEGFAKAKERVKALLDEQIAKATEPRAKETFTRAREQVARLEQGIDFTTAKRLLDGGQPADAAAAFERFAGAHAASQDAANALFNAALAWERAGRPEKAVEAREKLLASYGDAKMAPMAALYLASAASKRGDHEVSARHYVTYIERWPDAPNRCLALQNVGYELDVQEKKVEAAERYLAFGTEARCAKERPNEVAKALYRSGKLFIDAGQKPKAKQAFEAAAQVEGVTDATAQRQVEDAKRQIKRL
ncbi:MAG TPA: tetratricopeptide repeat protein [Anaeromyxobacteraceae bacterium]|nr:tetratricopeptide repeat protein [Anaeromyxobacteraceae bacterium]